MKLFSIIGYSSLLTIVLWDLIFDFNEKNIAYAYYKGHQLTHEGLKALVPIIIIMTYVPLFIEIFRKKLLLDYLTVLINIPCMYIFFAVLIPNQTELLKLTVDDSKTNHYLDINKQYHLILLGVFFSSLVFQSISHQFRMNSLKKFKFLKDKVE